MRTDQSEIRPSGDDYLGNSHDRLIRNVAIGEHDVIHLVLGNQRAKLLLRNNGNPLGVARSGEATWVAPPGNIRNLCGGKGNDFAAGVVSITTLKVVKIASGCSQYKHMRGCGLPVMASSSCGYLLIRSESNGRAILRNDASMRVWNVLTCRYCRAFFQDM